MTQLSAASNRCVYGNPAIVSKKHKQETCVYCVTPESSETSDHVIARKFFPEEKRTGLPIVPACTSCNNEKSRLELYAMSVMPFGATHPDSATVLSTMVPARLAKNQKLARTLADGMTKRLISQNGGSTWETAMTLPLDGAQLQRLWHMIVRGLAYSEFDVFLPDRDCVVLADYMASAGRACFDQLFVLNSKHVKNSLGDGIFVYEGVQSYESPQLTLWRMSLCGSEVSGDVAAPMEKASMIYAITAPRKMKATSELVQILRNEQQRIGKGGQGSSYTYRLQFPPA